MAPIWSSFYSRENYQVHAQSRRADTALSSQDCSLNWQAIDICNLDALHALIAEVSLAPMTNPWSRQKMREQLHLVIGCAKRQVRIFQREDRAFDARVLSTMDVVEWPGTISMRMISPPSASTISRPTTS